MEAIREENEVIYDFFGELLDEREAAFISKFMEDMPTKLFFRKPVHSKEPWIFWSQESSDSEHTSTNLGIQDRIKIALSKICPFNEYVPEVLVQFWAAEMIGGRRHLTTTLQPFALKTLWNEKLNEYRKHCVGFKFLAANVENDGDISMDGIVGRVFRNKLFEWCVDLSNYSVRDYPQRDLALSYGITSTLTLPLFEAEPGSGGVLGCVGVLELLFTNKSHPHYWYVNQVNPALKTYHLYKGPIREEIKAALKQVCNTYDLSHAITWVSYGRNMSCKDSRESFQGELLFPSSAMSIFPPSVTREIYFLALLFTLLLQGLAEKAFIYNNPYFCRDVSKLRIGDHHLAQKADTLQFASWFIVCLRNISTGKHEFIIEFFQRKTYSGYPVTLFSSILATMKQQLKTFEVVTNPQNEIFIEAHELGESFVKASTGKCKSVIYKEQSNATFTSYKTLSAPTTSDEEHTETEYSYKTLSAPTTSDEEHTETEYLSNSIQSAESTSTSRFYLPRKRT